MYTYLYAHTRTHTHTHTHIERESTIIPEPRKIKTFYKTWSVAEMHVNFNLDNNRDGVKFQFSISY